MKFRKSYKNVEVSINPWMFSQDDMTLIDSEFSEPTNGHSDVHDMP